MEQFIIERPEVSNHVSTLKADLSDMIQALSGTLGNVSIADEKEVEAAIDNEVCQSLVSLEIYSAHKCVCLNLCETYDSRKVPKICFEFIKLVRHTASGDNRSTLAVQNCLHYSVWLIKTFLLGSLLDLH